MRSTENVRRTIDVVLSDNTTGRASLLYQHRIGTDTGVSVFKTYLLLPLEPKYERKLQAEDTQFTDSL